MPRVRSGNGREMSGTNPKIALLRAVLSTPSGRRVALGVPRLDNVLSGGLMRGALHEVFAVPSHEGAAAGFVTGLVVRLGGAVLWIRQDYAALEYGELAATGLDELGLDPARVLLLRVPDTAGALRAAADALRCDALGAVVIELVGTSKRLDLVAYRRLALAAGASGVTVLLLRFSASSGIGGVETRWLVRSGPSSEKGRSSREGQSSEIGMSGGDWGQPVFDLELQRNRHGPAGRWIVEWRCDDGVFRPPDRGAVVLASAGRPSEAALAQNSAA